MRARSRESRPVPLPTLGKLLPRALAERSDSCSTQASALACFRAHSLGPNVFGSKLRDLCLPCGSVDTLLIQEYFAGLTFFLYLFFCLSACTTVIFCIIPRVPYES